MRDKTKQKLWNILFMITIPLLLLGFCGAMVMNRMEMTGRPATPEWKTALVVFQIIILAMAAVLFRLMPKKV